MKEALPLWRIVVGVDGSAASAAAVSWAMREAYLRHAAVHLVCACHDDTRLRAPYQSASWDAHQGKPATGGGRQPADALGPLVHACVRMALPGRGGRLGQPGRRMMARVSFGRLLIVP